VSYARCLWSAGSGCEREVHEGGSRGHRPNEGGNRGPAPGAAQTGTKRSPSLQPAEAQLGAQQPGAGVAGLGLLTLAIICGALGFALHAFWIAAIILMAAQWGLMVPGLQRSSGRTRGAVAEAIGVVVEEAREVADAVPRSDRPEYPDH
jgi:hypothetical protein